MSKERRTHGAAVPIDPERTRAFFEQRARGFRGDQPLTSVLYQDANPQVAAARDAHEKALVLPQLQLHAGARVLDIGCGIGRWADAALPHVASYCGVDFSAGLIALARERCEDPRATFFVESAENAPSVLADGSPRFDRVVISGVLIYLNDAQVEKLIADLPRVLSPDSLIYIREPVGLVDRLTLNQFWSEELKAEYSAIYRSRSELEAQVFAPLRQAGFGIVKEEPVYRDDNLNNRRETLQFYFLLQRGGAGAA